MSAPVWTPPTDAQMRAAEEITDLLCKALRTPKGIAYERAILCAAQLAGTQLLRSQASTFPGQKSGELAVNREVDQRGPMLNATLGAALRVLKVEVDPRRAPNGRERAEALDISALDAQHTFEKDCAAIFARRELALEPAAHACALSAAQLIQMSARQLDPLASFALASYGFLMGAKTVPLPAPAG